MALLCAFALLGEGRARAGDAETRACIAAVQEGQVLHRDGRLRQAREKFIACARDACPTPVRKDCITWLGEVESSLPSVVFAPHLREGRELRTGRVIFDGEPLQGSLNGRAVTVDPGSHVFRFELEGAKPLSVEMVIHEGEKNRLVAPTLDPVESATPAPAPAPPPRAPSPEQWSRPVPVSAYVAMGVSAIGLGGFAFFALRGKNQLDQLRDTCVSHCAQDDVDSARRQLLVGDIFLAGGVVSAGVATWLVLTRPRIPAGYMLNVQPLPGGAGATLRARF